MTRNEVETAIDPLATLLRGDPQMVRSYEEAATAVGRLDASGRLAEAGLTELLVLRASVAPFGAGVDGMIALVRRDSAESSERAPLRRYHAALRSGAARARAGTVPSVATLCGLLELKPASDGSVDAVDLILRDPGGRTPPVLRAVAAAGSLLRADVLALPERATAAALALSLVLCAGGAIADAWLALPMAAHGSPVDAAKPLADEGALAAWMSEAFNALAREAHAAEEALAAARHLADSDEQRVRDAFGRAAYSALDVLRVLRAELAITIPEVARALDLTPPTAGAAVARLVDLGIAREVTGRVRSRAFVYRGLVEAVAVPSR